MAENPILIEEEEDHENSPPPPTTPVSERPTPPPPVDEIVPPLGEELRMFPIMFIEVCLNNLYVCYCLCT